jgi:broad specificity phosphatase PhoE
MSNEWHRIYLVRHGLAAASWEEDTDPGLSPTGHGQAAAAAQKLAPLGPMNIISSPMRRTQETAIPFEEQWQAKARIDERISEIPSPSMALNERRGWLMAIMEGKWTDPPALATQPHDLPAWRRGTVEALLELTEPTIVSTHFVAINAIVGQLIGDDTVVGFRPDNCSITIIESNGQDLRLVEKGAEAETEVG